LASFTKRTDLLLDDLPRLRCLGVSVWCLVVNGTRLSMHEIPLNELHQRPLTGPVLIIGVTSRLQRRNLVSLMQSRGIEPVLMGW
jgi:hypothetical protein